MAITSRGKSGVSCSSSRRKETRTTTTSVHRPSSSFRDKLVLDGYDNNKVHRSSSSFRDKLVPGADYRDRDSECSKESASGKIITKWRQ